MTKILMVPGLTGSSPEHWQTLWEQTIADAVRVEQDDWDLPNRNAWIERLARSVTECGPDVVLAGHSLGAMTIVHWAARYGHAVRGAMLVAPTDLDATDLSAALHGWSPTPMSPLPFSSIVVARNNDPWISLVRARFCGRLASRIRRCRPDRPHRYGCQHRSMAPGPHASRNPAARVLTNRCHGRNQLYQVIRSQAID